MSKIIGKIIFKAIITNKSPLIIATGEEDIIDFQVIKDSSGNPFIPGSGFAGMLRNSFEEVEFKTNPKIAEKDYKKNLKYFWGDNENNKDTSQSHIIIDDLKLNDKNSCKVSVRDGVRIKHTTGLAEDGEKYDYEIIEEGAKFDLRIEATLREGFEKDIFVDFLYFIINKAKKEEYQQGAFKSNGFGILSIKEIKLFSFDFPNQDTKYFKFLKDEINVQSDNIYNEDYKYKNIYIKERNILTITGLFSIKNSLIIRSDVDEVDTAESHAPDKTHLKNSKKQPLITAKSIRGAIRHRAIKILKTLEAQDSEDKIYKLFGNVDKTDRKAIAGRFITFETKINEAETTQIQPRIKIDRFTGGTIESALMQTQPLWHKDEQFELKFEIKDCIDYEAGLMLLVMKDLINEDLAIGGEKAIGRGVLKGASLKVEGTIKVKEKESCTSKSVCFEFDKKGIKEKHKSEINTINNWLSAITTNKN
jgi:CRISPR/Cas system CSM-associated protein Csm3 (group 7 of RAMP superfamily)